MAAFALRLRLLVLTALIAAVCLPATAFAAHKDDTPLNLPQPSADSASGGQMDGGGMLLRTLLALLITVAVIYGVYRLVRLMNRKASAAGGSPAVQVLARTQADKDLLIYTVQIGDQVSLVGRTSHGIQVLDKLPFDEASDAGLTNSISDRRLTITNAFAELRARIMGRPATTETSGRIDDLLDTNSASTQTGRVDDLLEGGA